MALIIDAPMPKGKCWWEENGVEHECHLFPCWGDADNCPIIAEIPDNHGDLIEGEKVLKVLDAVLDNKEFIKIRQTLIDAVPIVLEATE